MVLINVSSTPIVWAWWVTQAKCQGLLFIYLYMKTVRILLQRTLLILTYINPEPNLCQPTPTGFWFSHCNIAIICGGSPKAVTGSTVLWTHSTHAKACVCVDLLWLDHSPSQSLYWDQLMLLCVKLNEQSCDRFCLEAQWSLWLRTKHCPDCIPQGQAVQCYLDSLRQGPPEATKDLLCWPLLTLASSHLPEKTGWP